MTRNGVVYNLIESPYRYKSSQNIYYYFSSKNHLEKFKETLETNRASLKKSLFGRFKINLDMYELYDTVLYNKIETRGFLIMHEGRFFNCPGQITLNGVKAIKIGLAKPFNNSTQK